MKPRFFLVLSLLLLFGVALSAGFSASGDYDITPQSDSSLDIPEYTVTYEGTNYTADSLSTVNPGQSLTVDTRGPENTSYVVYLVDKSERVRRSNSGIEETTTTFDTDGLQAGTYAVVIQQNSTTRAMYPVIIEGYTVTSSYRQSVAPGTEPEMDISLSETDSDVESPNRVTVTVWNDSVTKRETATRLNETSYRAQIPTQSLSEGTYSVIVAVEGSDQIAGQNEIVAVSDTSTVTVAEPTTPTTPSNRTPTATEDGSDTGQTGPDAPPEGDPVTTATATPAPSTPQPSPEPTTEPDRTSTATESTDRDSEPTTTPTTATSPERTVTSPAEPTAGSGPGFAILQPLLAVLVLVLLARRHAE